MASRGSASKGKKKAKAKREALLPLRGPLTSDFFFIADLTLFSLFCFFFSLNQKNSGRRRLEVRAPRRALHGGNDRGQAGERGPDARAEVRRVFFRLFFFLIFFSRFLPPLLREREASLAHRPLLLPPSLSLSLSPSLSLSLSLSPLSLTIISATAGGLQIVPTAPRALAYTLQLFFARSPAARAAVDLKLHFAPSTLDAHDATGGATRRELLHEEYVEGARGGGAAGQSRQGFLGQLRAVWAHRVTRGDVALVRRSPFPVLVLHGRSDLLAPPKRGAALAARLGGAYVELEGAHFLTRERGPEVNALVRSVVGGDLAGSSSTTNGAAGNSPTLASLPSIDDDANYCGGWAVPDPHRDLVPKQGWWRHRVLRGSMTRLSSALTGAGGSMAALAAQASAAASAAAAAAANAATERKASSLASALSTPLVIDDATTDVSAAAASPCPSPARTLSPAPRLASPYAPPTDVVEVVGGGGGDLRYASSPEPWSRETSFDDAHLDGGGGGVVEWISPPGDGSSGSLGGGNGSGSGSDDNSRASSPAVVLKGAALVSPAGSPLPRHRRHNQHLSFMTKRCSTADAGTPPPASLMRHVAAPATATSAASSSLFKNRRSPSPSAEPPRTPPHASRGEGGAAAGANGGSSGNINSNGSFAFKRGNLRHDLSSSNEDLRGSEDDERRHGSQCPFVDPVARGVGAIVDSSYDADE